MEKDNNVAKWNILYILYYQRVNLAPTRPDAIRAVGAVEWDDLYPSRMTHTVPTPGFCSLALVLFAYV